MENALLRVFFWLVPTQLGRHWWPEWSYVLGIRVDYLSPTLYLLDIVWAGFFLIQSLKFKIKSFKRIVNFRNLIIILFILANVLVAKDRAVAVYKWLRVGQWMWMVMYLRSKRRQVKGYLVKIIPCWIALESLLGVAQIVKGGSMGGIFYWLGERSFRLTTMGIAQMTILGNGIIRAYGTFSHPNSLAGFLMVSLVCWSIFSRAITDSGNKVKYWVVMWLGIMGIVLTGSRIVWLLGGMMVIRKIGEIREIGWKKITGWGMVGVGVLILLLAVIGENYRITDFIGGWDKASMLKRAYLNMTALRMIKDNLWLGVGMGNFLVRLPEYQKVNQFFWLQPVHNIFLLVMAEMGILGTLVVGTKLLKLLKGLKFKEEFWLIGIILITGMVDHYWISLPQNWWLMGIILGIGII